MQRLIFILLFLPLLALASDQLPPPKAETAFSLAQMPKNAVVFNRIVAVINNTPITLAKLDKQIGLVKSELTTANQAIPAADALRKQVLNQLIDQDLQLELAKRMQIEVSSDQVDAAIEQIATRNKMTISQMKAMLENGGENFADYRQQIRNQMIISQVQHRAIGEIQVSNAEIDQFLKQYASHQINYDYHLRDILIAIPNTPTSGQIEASKQTAEKLLAEIKQGKPFSEIAALHSAGQQALQGGDLGWRSLAQLPTLFVNTVINMQVGQVAGPIQAPNGFHILKLVAKRANKTLPNRNQVRDMLLQRKYEEKLEIWLEQLRGNAYVKIL